jgi:NitT/TauT family transport system substrate-binding protein
VLRRDLLKLGAGASAAAVTSVASPFILRSALAQEVSNVLLLMQHGLPYLPQMVMNEQKLVEKHAAKAGLPNVKAEYRQLAGTSGLIDALLAGQMHGGGVGVPALVTLWNRTAGTAQEVRALCAVQSMPYVLVTNNKAVKTLRDFTDKDKIALPAVKVSAQAVCLQMAAAKEWGDAEYAKLDHLTISRAHPEAATAVLTGNNEINSHYASAPFYQYELEAPGIHQVLKSYDTLGGPTTNGVMMMAKSFHDQNPKIAGAIYAALEEAHAFINANPGDAAEIYIKATNEKRADRTRMTAMVKDPDNVWTTTPQNAMRFASFMHKVGSVKKLAGDWKDMFLPEAHGLKGS